MNEEDKYFPSRFLRAADVQEFQNVTITSGSDEEFGSGSDKELRAKVSFQEFDKELVLNKTNYKKIRQVVAQQHGLDENKVTMSDWPGTVVYIYVTEVNFKGEMVDAIRIREPQGKLKESAVETEMKKHDKDAGAFAPDKKVK